MWGEQDSNLRRLSQQIYSLPRLTASVSPHQCLKERPFLRAQLHLDFKGMQNYILFSYIQIIKENCIAFILGI